MLKAFRSKGRTKGTTIVVWVLLGLLIVGLTGLGLGGAVSSLNSQTVARVGDEPVPTEEFVRGMFRQIDTVAEQTGRRLTMPEAQAFGLDQQVLAQQVGIAALNQQTRDLGLSVTDERVRDQLLAQPSFSGLTGGFDQAAYEFYLDRQGYSAREFEELLRKEISRNLIRTAVAGGVEMPGIFAGRVMSHLGEERTFDYARLDPGLLDAEVPEPTEADLSAYYDANPDAYTLPETRMVSYVALTPSELAASVDVSEDELRALYEDRRDTLDTPERRIVDALAFLSNEDAQAARTRIESGEINFEGLAEERGVDPADLALGPVERSDLGADAREAVFAAEGPGIVGPVTTDLGPMLYRLNAILAAKSVTFEDIVDTLRAELAADRAGDLIAQEMDPVQDLLAAGATLEEIADETVLTFGTVGLTTSPGDGLAGDAAFRAEAFEAEPGEDRDLIDTSDGGIAALRVDEIVPPTLQPLADVRDEVVQDWRAAQQRDLLAARAEGIRARIGEGQTFAGLAEAEALTLRSHPPVTRSAQLQDGLPRDLLQTVYETGSSDSFVHQDISGVYVVQVTEVIPFDALGAEGRGQVAQVSSVLDGQLAADILNAYTQMLADEAGVSVNQQLIIDTLAQYP